MREPIQLGTFQARSREMDARFNASKARRDRQFNAIVALHLVVIFTAASFLAFGLPEQQRLDRINQEIASHD